jgi:hypothetical protein
MKRLVFGCLWFLFQFSIQAQDDVYYDPKKDKGSQKSYQSNFQSRFESNTPPTDAANQESTSSTDPFRYDDANANNRSAQNDGYTIRPNRQSNTSFWDEDVDDFYYSSRLRRFYYPYWGCGFWDPWYTDLFFYTGNPMFWGSSIYVNVFPRWSWWRPRQYVIIYEPWGWNGLGWNSPWNHWGWNYWGWNNWYGWGWSNWGWNHWGWNNGYWNGFYDGYWNGYFDGRFGSWPGVGWYGKTYDVYGPRFQQTSTNSGVNSLPGKYGKTDETIPREGVLKPGTNAAPVSNRNSSSENLPVSQPDKARPVPGEGWIKSPITHELPQTNPPSGTPETGTNIRKDNVIPERAQPRQPSGRDHVAPNRPERNQPDTWNEWQGEQPERSHPRWQPKRTDEMRERLNREMEPAQRPMRSLEQASPRRNFAEPPSAPAQKEYSAPLQQRGGMQRFENNRQMEMRQMQPQRMERAEPMQRNYDMNRGGLRRNP